MENVNMTEWQNVKLEDVCIKITDGVHNTVIDDADSACFLLSCKNIKNSSIVINDNDRRISRETLINLRKRTQMSQGDVILSSVGTIGEAAIIKDENPNYEFQRSVAIFKPNFEKIISKFLYYSLIYNKAAFQFLAEGAVQQCLFIAPLKNFPISLPPLDVQKRIAGILGALDDRIDVLRRENVVLEQMAQAVFQSWFVDFDIVRAKAAGTPESEVCEKYHITPELYALFPSALTPDNLPLGWEKKNLGDISQYSKEKTTNVNIETYVSTENMLPNYGGIEKASSVPETGQSTRYKAGNVLISNIRPYFKKIWFADREGSCSNDVLVFFSNSIGKCMLYSILAQDAFFDFVMSGANGDKMPRGNKKHIMTYPVIFPNMDLLNKFENLVASLFDKKSKNAQQIRALSATRDALLPKLMNGEIEV